MAPQEMRDVRKGKYSHNRTDGDSKEYTQKIHTSESDESSRVILAKKSISSDSGESQGMVQGYYFHYRKEDGQSGSRVIADTHLTPWTSFRSLDDAKRDQSKTISAGSAFERRSSSDHGIRMSSSAKANSPCLKDSDAQGDRVEGGTEGVGEAVSRPLLEEDKTGSPTSDASNSLPTCLGAANQPPNGSLGSGPPVTTDSPSPDTQSGHHKSAQNKPSTRPTFLGVSFNPGVWTRPAPAAPGISKSGTEDSTSTHASRNWSWRPPRRDSPAFKKAIRDRKAAREAPSVPMITAPRPNFAASTILVPAESKLSLRFVATSTSPWKISSSASSRAKQPVLSKLIAECYEYFGPVESHKATCSKTIGAQKALKSGTFNKRNVEFPRRMRAMPHWVTSNPGLENVSPKRISRSPRNPPNMVVSAAPTEAARGHHTTPRTPTPGTQNQTP